MRHDPRHYLEERYLDRNGRRPRALGAYYAIKPLLPRSLQLSLRRAYAPRQAAREFPRWPVEDVLVRHWHDELRERMRAEGSDRVALVNPWPRRRRFAAILTHDVEGTLGVDLIERVRAVERRHGFVSSWNFCGDWYPIRPGTFEALRAEGCEIGLHGIKHDGRLFESRASFEANLPLIHAKLAEWGAVGFRSPSTLRNADWMPELGCLYDSSFPDTDPFEPQAGGCCSIFPYFLGDVVELPITLVQDHTLIEILREPGIDRWREKVDWLREQGGLVNVIVHPDYMGPDASLARYEALLEHLRGYEDGWYALPREVAAWWKARAAHGDALPAGTAASPGAPVAALEGGTVACAHDRGGEIVLER